MRSSPWTCGARHGVFEPELEVRRPVYIGDTITAHAEVLSVHPAKPVTQLRVHVDRDDGTAVLEGEAWCYTFASETVELRTKN